jgi:aryl-alcohol dehydrogenase (NADP+)
MEYKNLGNSGLKVSRICLGTLTFGTQEWRKYILDESASRPLIDLAVNLGINFFDTADMYSYGVSEEILGRALKDFARREDVVIATKVFFPMSDNPNDRGLSRKHILDSIDSSLRRLKTDYIDLYQIHRWDYSTPIEETLSALHDLVVSGKVRYIGASSMYAWQFAKLISASKFSGWSPIISMQNHYNLIYREEEREMIPLCLNEGVGLIPWSPLARGILAGNRDSMGGGETSRAKNDPLADEFYRRQNDFEIVDRVIEMAASKEASPAQISLAWILHRPGIVAPVVGVRKSNHLEQAVESLEINLNEDELAYLEEIYEPRPVVGLD